MPRIVSLDEIKENDFNLNVTLYVFPEEEVEEIDVNEEWKDLRENEKEIEDKIEIFLGGLYKMETEKERKIKALLNLEEIKVSEPDSYSSSTCGAHCFFSIECGGRGGYTEDPDFGGVVFEVLDTKRRGNEIILKIKAKIQEK